ncbi:MAG: prepilin-type N-terminal cleavage/methylation domain-containing protein [Candidatus Yonathbacteria bacterium]|nr:prepilin-type N-terminal cleavage/methylation domain-containing protein [Candidatus Yonathbacteria bacterium]
MNLPLSTFHFPLSTRASRGFTLVELLVTLGIFVLLTGIILSNYRSYNTNALFANASEDIVLALRQAQVYGVGVKKNITGICGGFSEFDCPYGVYFSQGANSIIIFADANGDRVYTATDDSLVETIQWQNSISILGLSCDMSVCTPSLANVTFKRPSPDAFIANSAGQLTSYGTLSVALQDANTGKITIVKITKAGQISLQ